MGTKICCRCNHEKKLSEFTIAKKTKDGRHSWCKECQSYNHRSIKYNLDKDNITKILKRQRNKCSICGLKLDKYAIDHDHKTGKVRGILCTKCNTGLGHFKDNLTFLLKACLYLQDKI